MTLTPPPAPLAPPGPGESDTPTEIPSRSSALSIAAVVVGGVAFFVGWVPVAGLLIGATAIGLGVIAVVAGRRRALAITGIGLGSLAALTSLVTIGVVLVSAGTPSTLSAAGSPPPAAAVEETSPAVPTVAVPDLVGLSVTEARAQAESAGFVVGIDGDSENSLVAATVPRAGEEVEAGSSMILTTQAIVAEPDAAASPAPTVTDLDVFRGQANGHLADMDKDLDDLIVTVDEGGFWRLLSNYSELAFNYGQLEGLDAPASVSGEWETALLSVDTSLTAMSDAIGTDDPALIRAQVDSTRGVVAVLRDIVSRAS